MEEFLLWKIRGRGSECSGGAKEARAIVFLQPLGVQYRNLPVALPQAVGCVMIGR
jgi:hypothetical protein